MKSLYKLPGRSTSRLALRYKPLLVWESEAAYILLDISYIVNIMRYIMKTNHNNKDANPADEHANIDPDDFIFDMTLNPETKKHRRRSRRDPAPENIYLEIRSEVMQ